MGATVVHIFDLLCISFHCCPVLYSSFQRNSFRCCPSSLSFRPVLPGALSSGSLVLTAYHITWAMACVSLRHAQLARLVLAFPAASFWNPSSRGPGHPAAAPPPPPPFPACSARPDLSTSQGRTSASGSLLSSPACSRSSGVLV